MSKKQIRVGNRIFNVDPGKPILWIIGIAVVIFLITAATSFYTIGPSENGLILRFGKHIKTTTPGLHWKIPWGIDELFKVRTKYQYKEEFGFRTASAGVETQYSRGDYTDESWILTGDLNITDMKWIVQYRITKPYNYLFKIRNPRQALRDISETAMRKITGNYSFHETLQNKRPVIARKAEDLMKKLAKDYKLGVTIKLVQLKDVHPPQPVRPSFNEVNEAQQEQETVINQAQQKYNKVIYRAKGEAERNIQEAEGYAVDRVNSAKGNVARFTKLYRQYVKAPIVTKKRLHLETMEKVLKKVRKKHIVDKDLKNVLPLLNISNNGTTQGGVR